MKKTAVVLIVIALISGACAGSEPTLAPPPTPIPSIVATPRAEPTAVPPTALPVPSPTAESTAPVIVGLTDQSISDMETFPQIILSGYLADQTAAGMRWSCSGNVELECNLLGQVLRVTLPNRQWTGSEILRLEVCNPQGLCDSQDVVFTVRAEDDPPVINLGDQFVAPGEAFRPIFLTETVGDEESAAGEITWSFTGNVALAVSINNNILTAKAPDVAWRGPETIHLRACDPGGACTIRDVMFKILEESDLVVTYINNAGFLFAAGGKKVLIDAMHSANFPEALASRLENAEPPFDGVDLILVTHHHSDHFDAAMIRKHMENDPKAIFVSTEQAVAALRSGYSRFGEIEDRVVAISLTTGQDSEQRTLNGIDLEMVNLTHGDPEEQSRNMGFIITIEGYRLFQTGDIDPDKVTPAYVQPYDLPGKKIDVALVPHFVLSLEQYHPLLREGIQARYYIPIHLSGTSIPPDYAAMARYFPNSIILDQEMESWVLVR